MVHHHIARPANVRRIPASASALPAPAARTTAAAAGPRPARGPGAVGLRSSVRAWSELDSEVQGKCREFRSVESILRAPQSVNANPLNIYMCFCTRQRCQERPRKKLCIDTFTVRVDLEGSLARPRPRPARQEAGLRHAHARVHGGGGGDALRLHALRLPAPTDRGPAPATRPAVESYHVTV